MEQKVILLVEDDFLNRRLSKKALLENNYKVIEAKNANEVLEILKKEVEYRNIKISRYSVNDILKQGYSLTRKNGKIVKRGIELSKTDNLEIQFSDMKVKVVVK